MNNKNIIVIPALSKFESRLGIHRRMRAGVFIPNRNDNPNAAMLESALYQLKHIDIIGWFTNEVGYQRGAHRLKKLKELCCMGEIDMVICYSKEDLERCEIDLENSEKSILQCDTVYYCIKECILITAEGDITLS